jgi:protease I
LLTESVDSLPTLADAWKKHGQVRGTLWGAITIDLEYNDATAKKNAATIKRNPLMEKVLVVVGDATETLDTMYPYYRLQEAGFQPVVTAPEKRKYQMVLHEIKPGWTITKEWEGYTIECDVPFAEVVPEEYLGILFSGGRAPEYIRYDENLVRITRHFFEANKPVASVCHGVEVPAYAGCVKGRRMATVPKCQFDLEICGGTFVNEPCVIDGNLVSGRTFHDNGHYVGPWIKLLEKARAEKLEQIV